MNFINFKYKPGISSVIFFYMIKYYFIGNETRGPKLIKALEEKGGINVHNYLGDTNDAIYYCNRWEVRR